MSIKTVNWDKCSQCGIPVERPCDAHIFCFYPNKEYTYEVMGRYCKSCTAQLFREMDLEILLKELTHLSLNFEFAFPLLMKKLNPSNEESCEGDQEPEIKGVSLISDNGPHVFNCDRCKKFIFSTKKPRIYFIHHKNDNLGVYCRECCETVYKKMSILEMVEEMMSGADIQKIGFEILKERLNKGDH
jgi:hypothetical protein